MQQVWAEFYEMWKAGEGYYLTADEVAELNEHNEQYTAVDPVEDRVMSKLNWQANAMDWRWLTATDILMEIGMDRPTRMDVTTCAAMVRKHNGNQGRRSHGKALLYVPPLFGDVPF
jgi:putative DNA primase/helicase